MKALSFAVAAMSLVAGPAAIRTWTDSTGQYKTEAEFVDFRDGIVRLRRADNGEIRSIPLEKLSEADQQFVKSRMEPGGGTAAENVDAVPQAERGVAPATGGAIPAQLLQRLKAATVLVKVRTRESTRSGSGFLLKKEGGVGYVVSAYLVADSPDGGFHGGWPPQCVFHSGTKREQSTYARPVVLDEQRHLAILRVELDTLPEPGDLDAKVALRETLPVWIIGFPLGDMVRTNERQPAVTVSRASISSLRRDDNDRIALIQIEGGINPGNSGGPVFDAQGRLIGIAVAKVVGTQIGMAIPAERVSEMLKPRVEAAYFRPQTPKDGVANVNVEVWLIDPMGKTKSASIRYVREDTVKQRPEPDQNGLWPPLPDSQKVEFQLQGQGPTGRIELKRARGEFKVPCGDATGVVYAYQIAHESGDGKLVYAEPGRFTVGLARPGLDVGVAKPVEPASGQRPSDVLGDGKPRERVVEFSWSPPPINVVAPPAETAVAGRIERESSGRRYTVLTAKGVTLDLGKDVLQVVACPTGKVVYVIRRDEPVVTVLDPLTWKSVGEIVVPESPTSIWADATLIGVACDKSRVVTLIDAQKRSVVASGTLAELPEFTPDTVIGRAPDGSVMSLWERKRDTGFPGNERALVHIAPDGTSRIMIKGISLYWATWLPDGTGVVAQSGFSGSPFGIFRLAFPRGPAQLQDAQEALRQFQEESMNELVNNRLLGGFHTTTGPAFLTSDRKALVFRRVRLSAQELGMSSGYRPDESVGERRAYTDLPPPGTPWTYLISPALDSVLREFPGSAVVELPEQRLFITVGNMRSPEQSRPAEGPVVPSAPSFVKSSQCVCYYVSSTDGRVVREITLQWPDRDGRPSSPVLFGPHSRAVFIPGHELLLLPDPDELRGVKATRQPFGHSGEYGQSIQLTYTAFRCGPVASNLGQAPTSAAPVNDPSSSATAGEEVRYAPTLEPGVTASEFRLKRTLPGMTIDPKTGALAWRPGKAYVGRWPITILATVEGKEVTVITWTLEVR